MPKAMAKGRWSIEEQNQFKVLHKKYGNHWKKIAEELGTRTTMQVRSHAQKKLAHQSLNSGPWSNDEKELFRQLYELHGRDWKAIAELMGSRSQGQVCAHSRSLPVGEVLMSLLFPAEGLQSWDLAALWELSEQP